MKLVILDRDGVINQDSVHYIKNPNEWIPIPDSLESIARLNQHGFSVIIATNQSGIGRGLFDIETMNAINKKMLGLLSQVGGHIDAIFYCPHTEDVKCECRKPLPGMILQAANELNISLETELVDALNARQIFLKKHGFINNLIDLDSWVDNGPLKRAQQLNI